MQKIIPNGIHYLEISPYSTWKAREFHIASTQVNQALDKLMVAMSINLVVGRGVATNIHIMNHWTSNTISNLLISIFVL